VLFIVSWTTTVQPDNAAHGRARAERHTLLPRSVRRAEPKFLPDRQTNRRPQATQAWNFLDSFRRRADGSPGAGSACQGCPVVRMYVRTFSLLGEKGEGVVFSRPLRALRALSLRCIVTTRIRV